MGQTGLLMTQLMPAAVLAKTSEAIGRVLITDDNDAIHEDFDKILCSAEEASDLSEMELELFGEPAEEVAKASFELFHADQGQAAYELLKKLKAEGETLDMAFIDMRMPPGWDGVETVEKLWEVDPDLQIVICTAFSDYNWSEVLDRLGANDKLLLLKKPFESSEVSQLALALTKKRQAERLAQQNVSSMEATIKSQLNEITEAHRNADRMLTAISSIVIGFDEDNRISRWNDTATRVFGISAQKAVGSRFEALSINWADEGKDSLREVTDFDCGGCDAISLIFDDSEGQSRHLEVSKFPLIHEGVREGGLLLGADVTEHKLLERQLQQAQKLESVGQLAAGVAHELNTPLQYILNNLEYLQETNQIVIPFVDKLKTISEQPECSNADIKSMIEAFVESQITELTEQRCGALDETLAGVEQVTRIVRAMKMFSHPGTDETAMFDLNKAIEMAITVSRNEWKFVASIERDFAEGIPEIEGFPTELNLVFLNLIVNASHALVDNKQGVVERTEPGLIRVSTTLKDDRVLIKISDSGCGIPPESCARVFDPFYTTKEVGKGTGQGLALAHNVVTQKHKGRIWVESVFGEGTTFSIELPLSQSEASPDNAAPSDNAVLIAN